MTDEERLRYLIGESQDNDVALPPGPLVLKTRTRIGRAGLRLRGAGYFATTLVLAGPEASLVMDADDQCLANVNITIAGAADNKYRQNPMLDTNGNGQHIYDVRLHAGDHRVTGLLLDGKTDNANHSVFERVRVQRTRGLAVRTLGKDGNANIFRDLTLRNCAVGVIEQSFLGNTYVNFAAYACGPDPRVGGAGFALVASDTEFDPLECDWTRSATTIAKEFVRAASNRTILRDQYIEKGQYVWMRFPQFVDGPHIPVDPGCAYLVAGTLTRAKLRRTSHYLKGTLIHSEAEGGKGTWHADDLKLDARLRWKNGGLVSVVLPKR